MKQRDLAREKARLTNAETDWAEFRTRRNRCTNKQRSDKTKYLDKMYMDMENETDSSKLFSTTKKLLGWTQSGPPGSFKVAGKFTQKQQELANWQADYFIEKINKIQRSIPQVCHNPLEYLEKAFKKLGPIEWKAKISTEKCDQHKK